MMPCGLELSGIFLGLQHFTFLSSTLSTILCLTLHPPLALPSRWTAMQCRLCGCVFLRQFTVTAYTGLTLLCMCVWGSVCREGGRGGSVGRTVGGFLRLPAASTTTDWRCQHYIKTPPTRAHKTGDTHTHTNAHGVQSSQPTIDTHTHTTLSMCLWSLSFYFALA